MENGSARVLVTGAGTGIGRAIALALAREGHTILATGRRLEPLRDLASEIGERCDFAQLDVGSVEDVAALARRWPDIDILINNAGSDVGGRRAFISGNIDDWLGTIRTNFAGVVNLCSAFAPGMVERGKGTIINVTSSVIDRSYAGSAVYASSKAAVHMFTDCLRAELHKSGVRILEIQPGLVRTDFDYVRTFGDQKSVDSFFAGWGETLTCEEIARAVLFMINQPDDVIVSKMTVLPRSDW